MLRSFCWPCGALLRPEPEPEKVHLNWLQRLGVRRRARPEVWHWDRRWLLLTSILPVCLVGGISLGWGAEALGRAVPRVVDRFSHQVPVVPNKTSASSSRKGFDAGNAVNGINNRAWAPDERGQDAVGATWTAEFQRPFRLTALTIINGASGDTKQYLAAGRPTRLVALATIAGGGTVTKELTLADQPGQQDFVWGVDNVVRVKLMISQVHAGNRADAPIALAEVAFSTRRGR
ncbi:hypothetical protein ACFY0Z_28900 [Streptomyces kronopolitis]|uniref:NADase-type glycan-binding domain-containing protein n=1 Tax=Streptomyces kronopolitis TaxID=1612435 RepID=UPI0036A4ACBE